MSSSSCSSRNSMIDSIASANPMFFTSPGRLPFTVGACATWPASLIDSATDSSSSPVCQAPCTSTYVLTLNFLRILGNADPQLRHCTYDFDHTKKGYRGNERVISDEPIPAYGSPGIGDLIRPRQKLLKSHYAARRDD